MRHPRTVLAGLSLAAALMLSSCSAEAVTNEVAASATTSVVSTSSLEGAVAELSYSDLGIDEPDLSMDDTDAVEVTLGGEASQADGVRFEGDTVTITGAGLYRVTGTLVSGSLVIDAPGAAVELVLDGVDITAEDVAAINVVDAEHVVLWLAEGSENYVSDIANASVDDTVDNAPNATLYSSTDLWIAGAGALTVAAHAADGITSKDTLVLAGAEITVEAADDGVRGKDHLVIRDTTLTVDAQGDALRSDNESVTDDPDAAVGVIWVDGGTLHLTAGADAVDAARQVSVLSGTLSVAAGDDGLHSDQVLRIAGGTVDITESVEGIEGAYMYLSGGEVSVVSADDGINVAGGMEALIADDTAVGQEPGGAVRPGGEAEPGAGVAPGGELEPGAGVAPGGEAGGRPAGGPPMGDTPGGSMGQGGPGPGGQFATTAAVEELASLTVAAMAGSGFGGPAEADNGTRFLELSGGTYVLDTMSDGVDVNGSMAMTGGTLVVSGTDDARNGALDVDDQFTISGGTLAANGTSAMAVAPGEGSTQATVAMTFGATVPAGTVITIADEDANQIASFTTEKDSQSLIYSSDSIVKGAAYTISVGGEATGTSVGWLVQGGTATGIIPIGTVAAW
jgi:hypothetical protein